MQTLRRFEHHLQHRRLIPLSRPVAALALDLEAYRPRASPLSLKEPAHPNFSNLGHILRISDGSERLDSHSIKERSKGRLISIRGLLWSPLQPLKTNLGCDASVVIDKRISDQYDARINDVFVVRERQLQDAQYLSSDDLRILKEAYQLHRYRTLVQPFKTFLIDDRTFHDFIFYPNYQFFYHYFCPSLRLFIA